MLYLFIAEYYGFPVEWKNNNKDITVSNYIDLLLFQTCYKFQRKKAGGEGGGSNREKIAQF